MKSDLNMDLLVLKENLKNLAPKFIRKFVRKTLKVYRNSKNSINFSVAGEKLTGSDLITYLNRIGINPGDTVLVHSSLSRLGYVDGGAPAVVDALLKAVGPVGTIGAPTFVGNTDQYLKGFTTFDVRNSPSILGKISEMIRQHPAAIRSMHPTHAAAFIGPQANYLVRDHHLDNTPVGRNSPYRKLADINGKILLLGVTLEYLTNFHTIEDELPDFPVKVYLAKPLTFKVIDYADRPSTVVTYCHCPEAGKKRQCIKMRPYLVESGVLKELRMGNATLSLLDAKLLHANLLSLYKKGITMYFPGS